MPSGMSIRLSEVSGKSRGTVCILHPYQSDLDSKTPDRARVDAYLKTGAFPAGELHWGLVFVDGPHIDLHTFYRTSELDILSRTLFQQEQDKHPEIQAVDCVSIERAFLGKQWVKSRRYVFLSEAPTDSHPGNQ